MPTIFRGPDENVVAHRRPYGVAGRGRVLCVAFVAFAASCARSGVAILPPADSHRTERVTSHAISDSPIGASVAIDAASAAAGDGALAQHDGARSSPSSLQQATALPDDIELSPHPNSAVPRPIAPGS